MLAIEDSTLITMMGMFCSMILNVVLALVNSRRGREREAAESAVRTLARRYVAESPDHLTELDEMSKTLKQANGGSGVAVADRTMEIVLSESLQMRAFGGDA